jgi:hypothetical protein
LLEVPRLLCFMVPMFSGHHVCAKLISLQFMQTFPNAALVVAKTK